MFDSTETFPARADDARTWVVGNKKIVAPIASCLMILLFLIGCADNKVVTQQTQRAVTNDNIDTGIVIENRSIEIPLKYIGNINSQILHVPTCDSLPYPRNRIFFETVDEAINQGYRKHYECMGK